MPGTPSGTLWHIGGPLTCWGSSENTFLDSYMWADCSKCHQQLQNFITIPHIHRVGSKLNYHCSSMSFKGENCVLNFILLCLVVKSCLMCYCREQPHSNNWNLQFGLAIHCLILLHVNSPKIIFMQFPTSVFNFKMFLGLDKISLMKNNSFISTCDTSFILQHTWEFGKMADSHMFTFNSTKS